MFAIGVGKEFHIFDVCMEELLNYLHHFSLNFSFEVRLLCWDSYYFIMSHHCPLLQDQLLLCFQCLLYDISNDCKVDDLFMSWKEVGGTSFPLLLIQHFIISTSFCFTTFGKTNLTQESHLSCTFGGIHPSSCVHKGCKRYAHRQVCENFPNMKLISIPHQKFC